MTDPKVAPVVGSTPSTETVQRLLYGRHYDELKKREKELADKAVKPEPQTPWPTTEDVQRTIAGGREPDVAVAPAASPRVEHKVAEAEPIKARYKTRESKAEE